MIKQFIISTHDLEFGNRLVATYYYYSKVIKNKHIKKGIQYVNLEDIAENISDGEHSHIQRNKIGGIRYLYGRNLKEGVINFDTISDYSYISEADYQTFKRCHIQQNDILISIYGTVGKSAIYKQEYVGLAGIPRHISNITLKKDSPLTPEFITAYFRSKIGKWQLENITTGNIQQLLSLKNIKKLDLPVPNKSFLKKVTKKEEKAIQCEIDALSTIEKASTLFYKVLNMNFDTITKQNYYSTPLSEIEKADTYTPRYFYPLYKEIIHVLKKNWQIVSLGEISTFTKGDEVGSDNYIKYLDKSNTDIPFIRTSDIVNHEVDQFPDYYVSQEIYNDLNQDIKNGDILFTKDGKIGVTGMITENDKIIIASGLVRIILKPEAKKYHLTPEYVFLLLSLKETGLYPALRRSVIASTIPHLREERIKEIEIPIIDENSINKITKLLSKAFELKNFRKILVHQVCKDIDEYFKN